LFFVAIFFSWLDKASFSSSTLDIFFLTSAPSSSARLSCSLRSFSLSIESWRSLSSWSSTFLSTDPVLLRQGPGPPFLGPEPGLLLFSSELRREISAVLASKSFSNCLTLFRLSTADDPPLDFIFPSNSVWSCWRSERDFSVFFSLNWRTRQFLAEFSSSLFSVLYSSASSSLKLSWTSSSSTSRFCTFPLRSSFSDDNSEHFRSKYLSLVCNSDMVFCVSDAWGLLSMSDSSSLIFKFKAFFSLVLVDNWVSKSLIFSLAFNSSAVASDALADSRVSGVFFIASLCMCSRTSFLLFTALSSFFRDSTSFLVASNSLLSTAWLVLEKLDILALSESLSLVFLDLSLNVTLLLDAAEDSLREGRVDLAAAEGFSQGFFFGTSSTAAAVLEAALEPHLGFDGSGVADLELVLAAPHFGVAAAAFFSSSSFLLACSSFLLLSSSSSRLLFSSRSFSRCLCLSFSASSSFLLSSSLLLNLSFSCLFSSSRFSSSFFLFSSSSFLSCSLFLCKYFS